MPPRCPMVRPENDSFFTIGGLDKAGISDVNQKRLFFREEAALLWDELDAFKANKMRGLDIEGCRGVGKSCEVWAWLCSENFHCESADRSFVLWVHLHPDLPSACTIFENGCLYWNGEIQVSMVKTLMQSIPCDMIVVDGVRAGLDADIRASAFAPRVRKIITVKSLAGKRYVESDLMKKISLFEAYPWAKNEYESLSRFPCVCSSFFEFRRKFRFICC